ncbi:2-amino-4-hydroxy-6-hydroxymethyldihydropteridine diphosphokinase [Pseudoroseicyclus tamaricis]|uniref:2-amino-4-hydroxy-6- hydroxymethyldihydropteridine diphosphokinase n=1 Tax=Pseudoroseicyclus tamaricis TaxID=2705421 RepID=UPI002E2941AB|nr:2-amino-4-hydroxy-6-hydroxymethyldihydropteridine diphosphokinase [Pseudoroseicyclus tamaricis]
MLVALGANLDGASLGGAAARDVALQGAAEAVGAAAGAPVRMSRIYRSPAFPPGSGPDYANAVLSVAWEAPPEEILAQLHEIEAAHGRERQARWAARTLDLDLIAAGPGGGEVRPDRETWAQWQGLPLERQRVEAPQELILPHPRLADRAFVLVPMAEVAPGWRHPVTGRSVEEMLAALPPGEVAALSPWQDEPARGGARTDG